MNYQLEQRSYVVSGMTCGHCAQAVQGGVSSIPGVESVEVDLASGDVKVIGQAFDDAFVRAAVEEAGYQVTR